MKTENTHIKMCIEEIKNTKVSGCDLESTLNFTAGWFEAEVKQGQKINYSSKDVLEIVKTVLGEE